MFVSFWGSSHWIGRVWCSRKETDLKIWSDCRTQRAYSDQHGTSSISDHPNQSQPARNKDRKDNNNPYCIAGWRSFDEGRLYTNPTLKPKNGKKKTVPGTAATSFVDHWTVDFSHCFLPISTWWSTSHVTHVA